MTKNNHSASVVIPEIFPRLKVFEDTFTPMIVCRYLTIGSATALIFLFQQHLPFKFPHLLYTCYAAFFLNCLIHLIFRIKSTSRRAISIIPLFDILITPFVFHYTGGFLSPFILTSLLTSMGSGIVQSDRNLSRKMTALHLVCYLSVALLQKFGILENSVTYSRELMNNPSFFFTVTTITTLIFGIGLVLVEMFFNNLHTTVEELTRSFETVVHGTTLYSNHDFFTDLAKCSTAGFNIRCIVIAQLQQQSSELATITIVKDGAVKDNFRMLVKETVVSELLSNPEKKLFSGESLKRYSNDPLVSLFPIHQMFALPLLDSQGKTIGAFYALHDKPFSNIHLAVPILSIFASRAAAELERKITDERRLFLEQQLAQSQKMQAIGHMAGGIAHDFNNIISAISGYAGLLKKRLPDDQRNLTFVEHIIEAGKHASTMTSQLSLLVKNDKPKAEPVDVHTVIKNTISMLQVNTTGSIKIATSLTANPSVTIGEETLLQNAIMNLGLNACDACVAGSGEVTISTTTSDLDTGNILCQSFSISAGQYVCIDVTDNGEGMTKEILSRIFEPYFTTKPKDKGTGLGLANVWKYVESYKGAIKVTSVPGAGTTFQVYLPLSDRQTMVSTTSQFTKQHSADHSPDAKKNILIVDDEESVREIYSEILSDAGYKVITCNSGISALELVDSGDQVIDLVLLDIIMPGKSGPETFRELRLKRQDIKVILMSGMSINDKITQLTQEPGTFFFQKPCDDEQLLGYTKKMLSEPLASVTLVSDVS